MTSVAAAMPSSQVAPALARSERVLYVRAAGFPRRALAALVDTVLVLAIAIGVTSVAALALGVSMPRPRELGPDLLIAGVLDRNPMAVGAAGLFLGISALYHFYLGGITGQTLGKRLFRLRVISIRGTTPGPVRGIFRFFVLLLSVLPAGLGWLWCLFDREHRSLHDHLAGTHVIVDES